MDNQLDYSAMRFWWDVLQTIVLLGVTVYVWLKSRSQVNTTRIEQVEKTLVDVDKRLAKAIGHDDLQTIYTKVNAISRDLAQMKGESKQQNQLLHRIDDYLRSNQGGRS